MTLRLQALKPERLCVLDSQAEDFAAAALPATPRCRLDQAVPPCGLALGLSVLDGLDAASARHMIHRVRLYAAPQILLLAPAGCVLDDAAFRALGFIREAIDAETGLCIQSYDLATYKPVPDWLNARYWAHPERWEP
ncbi:MAG: hypothetical protein B7Y26_11010 [Hydrogenophilales bacterium 16-64-46]|nr:MAG: hypothetical protein B7Z32_11690 [Hydrogenophilales bacterium 12-64-13]OYZ04799.1 MAG: hypothetical protein B7Y26_11010 [Hydrogenophilales bacterium 16-64-46]OZA38578.1 MAG: hypothetical protein B7X87_07725 [Hydrogenophilales bacterium 17-64-34]